MIVLRFDKEQLRLIFLKNEGLVKLLSTQSPYFQTKVYRFIPLVNLVNCLF
jgi:hypothetical protein